MNRIIKFIFNQDRKITTIAGILYLLGFIAGILSISYTIDDPNYLTKASLDANNVTISAFFHLLMAPLYCGIAILLYPILKRYNQLLALGFAGFRFASGIFIIFGVIILLLLLSLSQEYVKSGIQNPIYFQTIGVLLQTARDLLNHVATILSVSISGLMYYILLYKTKLIPRWLSAWGLVGVIFAIAASLLFFFHIISIITTIYIVLNIPMALQEIVLALWLIIKGFNPSVRGYENI
jgi:hypothetical protein